MSDPPAVSDAAHVRSLAALHLAVLLFGFAGLFGKWIALPSVTIVLGRAGIAALTLALLGLMRDARAGETARGFDWRLAAGGAVLALHWVAFFQAIQLASVAVGLLGYASFPVFVLLLEALLCQRPLHARDWLIAALVTIGLVLLVPELRLGNRMVQGLLWGLLSGFTFALLAVGNRGLAAGHSPQAIALWQNGCAAVLLVPAALMASAVPNAHDIVLIVVLGVACTALAHTLFIRSLRALSAHTASVVAALEPVYGIALAFALLGEAPSPRTLAGAALIVGAALYATKASRL